MSKLEKYTLLAIILIAFTTYLLMAMNPFIPQDLSFPLGVIFSLILFIGLIVFYIIKTKKVLLKVVFIGLAILAFSVILKIVHFPMAGALYALGSFTIALVGIYFLFRYNTITKEENSIGVYYLILGFTLILIAIGSGFILPSSLGDYAWCFLIGTLLFTIIKKVDFELAEKRALYTVAILHMYKILLILVKFSNTLIEVS